MIPTDLIDMLDDTWRSISSMCGELTEIQWKLTTDLPGWSVQDNLSHLIGIERMLQGLPAAPSPADVGDHVRNAIGQFNEAEVDARRGRTGAEVLKEWNDLVAVRLDTLRAGGDAYFAVEMSTPTGPGTLTDFLSIRVLDCWLHEQDIRRAVDRPGNLGGAAAEHTIDRLLRTIPVVVGKRAATPEGGAVAINITGPVRRNVVCEVTGGRAATVVEPTHPPLASITLDCEAFAMLATGRRSAAEMPDRVVVSGDPDLAQRVVGNLNMMI